MEQSFGVNKQRVFVSAGCLITSFTLTPLKYSRCSVISAGPSPKVEQATHGTANAHIRSTLKHEKLKQHIYVIYLKINGLILFVTYNKHLVIEKNRCIKKDQSQKFTMHKI